MTTRQIGGLAATVEVGRVETLTPLMRRITVTGAGLRAFADVHLPGDAVKVALTAQGRSAELDPDDRSAPLHERLAAAGLVTRVYTLRDLAGDTAFLDVLLHAQGPGAAWGVLARPGDRVTIAGPAYGHAADPGAGEFVLIADHAALPALAETARALPAGATAHAYVALSGPGEAQKVVSPARVRAHWITPADPGSVEERTRALLEAVRAAPWRVPGTRVWAAGETGLVKALRRYIRRDLGVPREHARFSGYWTRGKDLDAADLAAVPEELRAAYEAFGYTDNHVIEDIEPSVDLV
ncbi:siderophore-interacting protein [Nocardiopsis sp. CNT-189]|uniref:siderophore-interacting protein n=1 Tax=Nocardiopsis oceanisediminis TaxID=2816862 RepID=UPI003B39F90F